LGRDVYRFSGDFKYLKEVIGYGPDGLLQDKISYCDPSSPYQKGSIEINHELVRRIFTKGSSFDELV